MTDSVGKVDRWSGMVRAGLRVLRTAWPVALVVAIVGSGLYARVIATRTGLPYAWDWDEPEILGPAIRVLRDGVYAPTRYAYGPLNGYVHAAWGVRSVLAAFAQGELDSIWDLATEWDTGWYWTISSPLFWQQARLLSVLMWLVTAWATWGTARSLGLRWGAFVALALLASSEMNFGQTHLVRVGAMATMFTSLAWWASALYVQSGERSFLVGATAAASAAVATKLTFFPVLATPIVAVLLAPRRGARNTKTPTLGWVCAGYVAFVALFMLPIFFDVPRFVHSLVTELAYYDKGMRPIGLREHVRAACLAGLASVDVGALKLVSGTLVVDTIRWRYAGYVLLIGAGVVAVAMRRQWGYAMVVIPALVNAWHVTSFRSEFFPRNVMIVQLAASLLAGAGFDGLWEMARVRLRRVGRVGVGLLAAVAFLLPMAYTMQLARTVSQAEDSRWVMARRLRLAPERDKKVLVAAELHWFTPPQAPEDAVYPEASLLRLLRHPDEARGFDYVVAPLSLAVFDKSLPVAKELPMWNHALGQMRFEEVVGQGPLMLDALSKNPKIGLIPASEFDQPLRRKTARITGFELVSAKNRQACGISGRGVAVRNHWEGEDSIEITTVTRYLRVKARGMNPFRQDTPATVTVCAFAAMDRSLSRPVAVAEIGLERSASGLREYTAPFSLPVGEYVLRVRARNVEPRFLTEIESLDFK